MQTDRVIFNTTAIPPDWSSIDRVIINLAGKWIGLGDVIAVSPLVSGIRLASPKSKIYIILTGNNWDQIVTLMEGNTKTINVGENFYRFRKLLLYGLFCFRRPWLKTAYFYDYMAPRYRASLFGHLIGAEFRFGYGPIDTSEQDNPTFNTHTLPYNLPGINVFDYSKDFKIVTNIECDSKCRLQSNSLVGKGRKLIKSLGLGSNKNLIAMHPGSSSNLQVKRWPIRSFARLAQQLNFKYDVNILVIVGPDEREARINWPKESHVTFLDGYSIYDIATILSCCVCLISNDSGIMNLGLSLGIPGVGLFGPTNSIKHNGWYPNGILVQSKYNSTCKPCYGTEHYWDCGKIPPPCMEYITVDEVIEKVQELLQKCAE